MKVVSDFPAGACPRIVLTFAAIMHGILPVMVMLILRFVNNLV